MRSKETQKLFEMADDVTERNLGPLLALLGRVLVVTLRVSAPLVVVALLVALHLTVIVAGVLLLVGGMHVVLLVGGGALLLYTNTEDICSCQSTQSLRYTVDTGSIRTFRTWCMVG